MAKLKISTLLRFLVRNGTDFDLAGPPNISRMAGFCCFRDLLSHTIRKSFATV